MFYSFCQPGLDGKLGVSVPILVGEAYDNELETVEVEQAVWVREKKKNCAMLSNVQVSVNG